MTMNLYDYVQPSASLRTGAVAGVSNNMKKRIFLLFFCFESLALSAQAFERVEPFDVSPLEIECSITYEDAELDYYSISWSVPLIDSIAKAEGELPRTELHCFVRDSSGIIGFYRGLSTPMQFCYFQTKDSIVEVFFRLRRMSYTRDSITIIGATNGTYWKDIFTKSSHRGSEFERVLLSVNSTKNRKLILLNDTNTVLISHGTRPSIDPYGQPKLGSIFSSVISLDRYYISIKTGRIATGQKWIDRKGPGKIVRNSDQFILVVPSVKYVDKKNNHYQGSEFIKSGRVKLKRFNLKDFIKTDKENIPY
jgi:hypothetical protein